MRSGADQLGMPDQEGENDRRLKSLLADYEAAATADLDIEQTRSATLQVFAEYYAEEFSWIEAPTPFYPQGRSGGRLEMTAAIERVSERLSVRRYTLVSVIASGDRVAAELAWEGTRKLLKKRHTDPC